MYIYIYITHSLVCNTLYSSACFILCISGTGLKTTGPTNGVWQWEL